MRTHLLFIFAPRRTLMAPPPLNPRPLAFRLVDSRSASLRGLFLLGGPRDSSSSNSNGRHSRLVNRSAPTTARHPDLRRSSSSSSPSSSSSDSDSDFRPSSSLSPTTHARLLEVRDGRRAARRAGKQLRKEAKREKEARKEREQVERRQLKEENKAMTREKRSGGVSVGQTVLATADAHSAQVTRWIVVEPA